MSNPKVESLNVFPVQSFLLISGLPLFLILVSSSCCVLLCSFPILCPLWFPPLCSLAISCPPHFMPPAFFPHFKTLSSIISTLNTFHHSCISLTTFRTFLRSTSSLPPVFPHYKPTTSLPNLILTTPPPTRYSTRPPSHTSPPPHPSYSHGWKFPPDGRLDSPRTWVSRASWCGRLTRTTSIHGATTRTSTCSAP